MPEDTMASKDENAGEWICGPFRQEAIDSDIVKADPHSQKAQQILKKRAQETKRKLYLRIFEEQNQNMYLLDKGWLLNE
jgi:hypothetical protein